TCTLALLQSGRSPTPCSRQAHASVDSWRPPLCDYNLTVGAVSKEHHPQLRAFLMPSTGAVIRGQVLPYIEILGHSIILQPYHGAELRRPHCVGDGVPLACKQRGQDPKADYGAGQDVAESISQASPLSATRLSILTKTSGDCAPTI